MLSWYNAQTMLCSHVNITRQKQCTMPVATEPRNPHATWTPSKSQTRPPNSKPKKKPVNRSTPSSLQHTQSSRCREPVDLHHIPPPDRSPVLHVRHRSVELGVDTLLNSGPGCGAHANLPLSVPEPMLDREAFKHDGQNADVVDSVGAWIKGRREL